MVAGVAVSASSPPSIAVGPGLAGPPAIRLAAAAILPAILVLSASASIAQAHPTETNVTHPPATFSVDPQAGNEGAADDASEAEASGGEIAEALDLVSPVPVGSIRVPLPEGAPAIERAVVVQVMLRVEADGRVSAVELLEGAGPPWDEAVLEATAAFVFEPARLDGVPVAVEIPFVQRFEPPPRPAGEEEERLPARISGVVVERGTRKAVPHAAVIVEVAGRIARAETGADGTFALRAAAGRARIEVSAPGHARFVVHEELEEGRDLAVRYLVERRSYDPYETIVIGRMEREEVSRTTLRDREITRVPGTFGDPFRVVGTMPGVGQVFSLLSYPIVRGASPGSTGILLDGIRIPQLYHYLAGPAVIHPSFIDRVDFYPGSFPVEYGRYTGGIIDGITRRPRPDEETVDLGIDLTNASLMLRQPILGGSTTVSAAGRYGYPGMLLSAFSEDAFASYWDYQLRVDTGAATDRWTVFGFGAFDEVGERVGDAMRTSLRSQFHRLDLRYRAGSDRTFGSYAVAFGVDQLYSAEDMGTLETIGVEPRARWQVGLGEASALRLGVDGAFRRTNSRTPSDDVDELRRDLPEPRMAAAGGFVEVPVWITEDLLLTPGARLDVYDTRSASKGSVDPRFSWRYRAYEAPESAQVWLKGGVGFYHQPPRFFVPIPGLDELALDLGLPASTQTSLGAELELATGFHFDLQGYYHHMDPVLLEPVFGETGDPEPDPPGADVSPAEEEESDLDSMLVRRRGRSYGLELLVRKREGGALFGWIAYTLSRSERRGGGGAWEPFDFDRTHMLHVVAGVRLPRNWEVGGRFQVQSGRPWRDPDTGRISKRLDPFTRFDLRIDKRAIWNEWMLDFYIDVINVMIAPEAIDDSSTSLRYVLPTLGFRAVL
ncbi:MAG TPA: TonB-dependent receptor [Vulgatibacter sp.]|nr:TonB-dependent receptor [Vulgatibacter sp.]